MSDLRDKLQLVCRKLEESLCASSHVRLSNPVLGDVFTTRMAPWQLPLFRYFKHHPEKRGTAPLEDQASTSRMKQWNGKNDV
jgi:hypothetical protein